MFPIKGLVMKQGHKHPWVVYRQQQLPDGPEGTKGAKGGDFKIKYEVKAAFPPYPTPDRSAISDVFTK
jgi:hypothetical protein